MPDTDTPKNETGMQPQSNHPISVLNGDDEEVLLEIGTSFLERSGVIPVDTLH